MNLTTMTRIVSESSENEPTSLFTSTRRTVNYLWVPDSAYALLIRAVQVNDLRFTLLSLPFLLAFECLLALSAHWARLPPPTHAPAIPEPPRSLLHTRLVKPPICRLRPYTLNFNSARLMVTRSCFLIFIFGITILPASTSASATLSARLMAQSKHDSHENLQ